ncbi:MAG: tetratricopeptide repeat-containing sensor histidine kinase [Bacteroidales bacterium]|nr:tetratricopeptide repeat-containing sensor histidine kinase [Bacteroidales bacterium]
MKKFWLLSALMFCFAMLFGQDIDSLFTVFENNRGEVAYKAAVAIDETIGREPNFTVDTDKDEIKLKILRTMILYYFNHNDFQHVVQYSEIGIEHYDKIGDLFNEAGCLMTLANAYQRLGQLDKAIECYNRCSELMDEIGGEMAAVNKRYVMNNIAEIHLAMNEYSVAEEIYGKCIEMLGEVDVEDTASMLDLATYYQNLAEVHIALNKDDAVSYAEQSLELSRKYLDTPHKVINRLMTLSKAYGNIGKTKESERLLDEALQLAEEYDETYLQAVIHLQKGEYSQAIAMAKENHYDELLQEALKDAYLYERDRNPKFALDYYEQSMAMKDSVFNETQQQLIRDYQVKYATQEKEHALALEQEKSKRNRLYIIVLSIVVLLLIVITLIWIRLAKIRKTRNDELTHLNQTKDRLLSIVSHDVKTPVGAICTVLNNMTSNYESISDTDRKASLIMMHSSVEALYSRIMTIMQWVRGELANSEIKRIQFSISELVDECIKTQETSITMKSLKVNNEVPKYIMGYDDINVVRLVIQNLLGNAVKFSYPNGEITIKAEHNCDRAWISVSDNGMGISEAKLEKIFNYMTSSEKGTGGETGTGIGLFVSKQFIDKIGGKIAIESKKGIGTTVSFSIHCKMLER